MDTFFLIRHGWTRMDTDFLKSSAQKYIIPWPSVAIRAKNNIRAKKYYSVSIRGHQCPTAI